MLSLAACALPGAARAGEIDALLFGSLDAGAASFLSIGAKAAFEGLGQSGFVVMGSGGGGRRAEAGCGCGASLTRYTAIGAVVGGYQWVSDWGVVALQAGPEASIEALTDGLKLAALPLRWGLRLQGEVWARPTAETLVQANAVLGSARDSAWVRIGVGYRVWDTYFGPEASLYTDRTGYAKCGIR